MHLPFSKPSLSTPVSLRLLGGSGDLVFVYLTLVVTVLVQWALPDSLAPAVLGLPLLLFFPGYGLLLALFPRRGGARAETGRRPGGIELVERMALAFGTSLTIAPIVGLCYAFVGVPLTQHSVTIGFASLTALFFAVGEFRRSRLPQADRFTLPTDRWLRTVLTAIGPENEWSGNVVNLALVLSVVFAFSSLGYGILVPNSGEQYTNFYLVTQEGDGEFVAADYPANFTDGEFDQLTVGIDNHEGRTVEYHVVVELQRVSVDGAGTDARVVERERVHHRSISVAPNGTRRASFSPVQRAQAAVSGNQNETSVDERGRVQHRSDSLTSDGMRSTPTPADPSSADTTLRLTYLLYCDEVPGEPTVENAYRTVYLWVDTDDPDLRLGLDRQPVGTQPRAE